MTPQEIATLLETAETELYHLRLARKDADYDAENYYDLCDAVEEKKKEITTLHLRFQVAVLEKIEKFEKNLQTSQKISDRAQRIIETIEKHSY